MLLRKFLILIIITIFSTAGYSLTFSINTKPKNMGAPINSAANDFASAISPDGNYIIFNSKRGRKYQDLFISYLKNEKWSDPAPLSVVNSPFNEETPFISADGTTLLFSSDRDGSIEMPKDKKNRIKVSFDIYISKLKDGKWSKPVPIPGKINTMHHEKTPSLSKDGKTLYYAMWRFGMMSNILLVKASLKNGSFINPQKLPKPFNSGFFDIALLPAEDLGGFFFSSKRDDSIGMLDIYFVSFKDGKFGKVQNLGDKINSPKNELYLTKTDQRYFISSNRTGGKGLFDLYSSFIFQKENNFETRAIHFDFNRYDIKEESFKYLDALFIFLKENDKIKLKIIGHTDLHGTVDFNKELSIKRAQAVKEFLIIKGLQAERFQISGAGKSQPVVNKKGKEFDLLNRRTEFVIIK